MKREGARRPGPGGGRTLPGLKPVDAAGLLSGAKKLVSCGLPESGAALLLPALRRLGLRWAVTGSGHDFRGASATYLISPESAVLDKALAAYEAQRYDAVGRLLGYPACCVKRHCAIFKEARTDFVRRCAAASKRFLWPLNNIVNFDGRITVPEDRGAASLRHVALIAHNPCSYDCAASLTQAEAAYNFMAAAPEFRDDLARLRLLAFPVLYLDDYNFAVLDGVSAGSRARFGAPLERLGCPDLSPALAGGGELAVRGGRLLLRRGGKPVFSGRYSPEPLLLPFDLSAARGRGGGGVC